jgi:hypothetical protein
MPPRRAPPPETVSYTIPSQDGTTTRLQATQGLATWQLSNALVLSMLEADVVACQNLVSGHALLDLWLTF